MEQMQSQIRDGDRKSKRMALESIRDEFQRKDQTENVQLSESELKTVKSIINCLYDKFDSCRELSVDILDIVIDNVDDDSIHPLLIPTLQQRLGTEDLTESSEEVRLAEVKLLGKCIRKKFCDLSPYYENVINILKRTLVDPNPDIRIQSCVCTVLLAQTLPRIFHYQSETIIKPLLASISHQRFRVRVSVIEAIGASIQFGNNQLIKDVVSHLAQRLFDRVPQVRLAVVKVVGGWLIELPDRYSYFPKMIPLILTGLMDEVEEVKITAEQLWKEAGAKYLDENKDEYKEQIELGNADAPLAHYPPDVVRPSFGCRLLASKNIYQILPILVEEVDDWMSETREKTILLLFSLLVNVENNITQSLPTVLKGLRRAFREKGEKKFQEWVDKTAELIGYFVEVDTWKPLVVDPIIHSPTPERLLILSFVMRGTDPHNLERILPDIAEVACAKETCRNLDTDILFGLWSVTNASMEVCKEKVKAVPEELFTVLVTITALSQEEKLKNEALESLNHLAELCGAQSRDDLFGQHMDVLLEELKESCESWSVYSYEYFIFRTLLSQAGEGLGNHLNGSFSILRLCIQPESNVEVRLQLLTLLGQVLTESSDSDTLQKALPQHLSMLLKDILIPELRWCPGRTASALRTAAVCCVWCIFCCPALHISTLSTVSAELIPCLTGLLQDDNHTTRLVATKSFGKMFQILAENIDGGLVLKVYPELLNRLDDVRDDIRIAATRSLSALTCTKVNMNNGDHAKIFSTLLVHLDDDKLHAEVKGALQELSPMDSDVFKEELQKFRRADSDDVYEELSKQFERNVRL